LEKLTLCIVVPVYNNEGSLRVLCQQLQEAMDAIEVETALLFVDDCSKDSSWQLIGELASQNPAIAGHRLSKNHGQALAVRHGIQCVESEWYLTMDADLQDSPADIQALWEHRHDCVQVVARRSYHSQPLLRRLVYKVAHFLGNVVTSYSLPEGTSGFRLMHKTAVSTYLADAQPAPIFGVSLDQYGLKTAWLDAPQHQRYSGRSQNSVVKLFQQTVGMVRGNPPVWLPIPRKDGCIEDTEMVAAVGWIQKD
jgi:glycosyltransferase involved in cell wall biosynthesis